MKLHPSTARRFSRIVADILEWHSKHQRTFAWRGLKRTPYVVLVSEFMLQQTGTKQVERMLPIFLERFPNFRKLAEAPPSAVLRAWQGLGYNRRALNLHNAAKAIVARGRKPFPDTLEELMALPGVGAYTASAVMTFALGKSVSVVDVNVERVLSRLWKEMPGTSSVLPMKQIATLNESIFPADHSQQWHEALMDIGSTICTKRNPSCETCFLLDECKSGPGFLKRSGNSPLVSTKSKEPIYFGQPRRIWRGRALKIIADHHRVSRSEFDKQLIERFAIPASEHVTFKAFSSELLKLLIDEGFARFHRAYIKLAD